MAALTAVNPKVVLSTVPMATTSRIVLNGQSWKAGQFLYLDANGYLKTCATDAKASTGGIKFYALTDQSDPANNTTYAEVGVITSDTVFEGNELDGAVTCANIGPYYAINVASNVVTVDVDDTGNDSVVITEIGPDWDPAQYLAADTLAKIRFKIIDSALQAENA